MLNAECGVMNEELKISFLTFRIQHSSFIISPAMLTGGD